MKVIDFHNHTHFSYDSMMNPIKIIKIARKRGLTGIVINDHNTIQGGLEAKRVNPYPDFEVIVGAEIKTDAGDITGIFLNKEIETRSFREVALEIKAQGGLVILNHPFVAHKLELIDFSLIDLIEGYNSRLTQKQNQLAIDLAKEKNKPVIAGSDSHVYSEIARCVTFYNNDDLLNPMRLEFKRTGYFTIPQSQFIKAYKKKDVRLFSRLLAFTPKHILKRFFE